MNYIRGAVNAISAPYQYYKDLPPINPSTLTGAIDVIVIERPTDSGDSELVCSPFHVRFGKWQVLRPGEKKVTVSVNGYQIPFNMKIGEAGEAFFVFETEDDVPADLITSPILHPTIPQESMDAPDIQTGKFGTKSNIDDGQGTLESDSASQEPEFLDLDASPAAPYDMTSDTPPTSRPGHVPHHSSSHIPTEISHFSPPEKSSGISLSRPVQTLPSPPLSPSSSKYVLSRSGAKMAEALSASQRGVHAPEVTYKPHVALDMSGYHSREESDKTITSGDDPEANSSLSFSTSNGSASLPDPSQLLSLPHTSPSKPSKTKTAPGVLTVPFPILRATSEPPTDVDEERQQDPAGSISTPHLQEYSWEWGAFPQPSPMKPSFGKSATTVKGNSKLSHRDSSTAFHSLEAMKGKRREWDDVSMFRSHSVPPELDGSPTIKRRELSSEGGPDLVAAVESEVVADGRFGAGGRLKVKKDDPTCFGVYIEGKMVPFELSIISDDVELSHPSRATARNTKDRDKRIEGGIQDLFTLSDEVETASIFDSAKVTYEQFLDHEDIVLNDRLVIRWAREQYITRNDGSPLMDALILWRNAALQARADGIPSRLESPASFEQFETAKSEEEPLSGDEQDSINRATSEPFEQPSSTRKPTSSSWVRWWSRSRTNRAETNAKEGRPYLRGSASEPSKTQHPRVLVPPDNDLKPAMNVDNIAEPAAVPQSDQMAKLKYVKTLRLTSDQLKSLNLKHGANSITFSLSSGVIACTARIFVWDSTDLIVVSDIDGTITKSDGLGHIFTMIGRDWTHLGVAKLYTDITRNGYKIMYLTSRAIGQADSTRDYLKGIKQNDYQLPEGPVIMSPDRLMASLHREVIMRKPEVFKMACLRDIQRLFGEASRNPFYAGFGNRITDALSYRSVNVPSARIFTIDSSGEVKMELLELAGYKSSYIHMTDLVDQMFPPIHRKWAPEFTDFNYWKTPVQEFALPDLTPPSPALSARSDTSNQSTLARIRNFSLVGSRQSTNAKQFPAPTAGRSTPGLEHRGSHRDSHLRQMSSFERLSNTLAQFTQPSSYNSAAESGSPETHSRTSYSESEEEFGDDGDRMGGGYHRRERRRSMESMPGSLDDMQFDMDEDGNDMDNQGDEDADGYNYEIEETRNEEEAAEEAFDEDFLRTGEMQNVPF